MVRPSRAERIEERAARERAEWMCNFEGSLKRDPKNKFTQSQQKEGKITDCEFNNALKPPTPSNAELGSLWKNSYKKKGERRKRTKRQKAKPNAPARLRRKEEAIEEFQNIWRGKNSVETLSRKRLRSYTDFEEIVRHGEPAKPYEREQSPDLFDTTDDEATNGNDGTAHLGGGMEIDVLIDNRQRGPVTVHRIPQNHTQPNVCEAGDDVAAVEGVFSQLSTDDRHEDNSNCRAVNSRLGNVVETETSGFYSSSAGLLHLVPRMRKSLAATSTDKPLRERMANLRSHARALARGCAPIDEQDDEECLQNQLRLIEGVRDQILTEQKNRGFTTNTSLPKEGADLTLTTAAYVSSFSSCNKLRTANGILRLAGFRMFASDRKISSRLALNTSWMQWEDSPIYFGDEAVQVSKVVNLRETISQYVNETWETLDIERVESKKMLVLRIGVDRGAGRTKIGLSIGNRRRAANSPFNWIVVASYDAKDNAVMLRQTVSDIFTDFDKLNMGDLDLRDELQGSYQRLGKVLIGDIPSVSAVLGLKGHQSKNPCFLCDVPKECLNEKGNARDYTEVNEVGAHSHAQIPLLKNVYPVVPILHCFQGPATNLFYKLEADVKKAVIGSMKGKPVDTWFSDMTKVRSQREVAEEVNVLKDCKKRISNLRHPDHASTANEDCTVWCGLRKKRGPICWRKCDCGRWHHSLCVGILPSQMEIQLLADDNGDGKTTAGSLQGCPACSPSESTKHITNAIDQCLLVLRREVEDISFIAEVENKSGVLLSWANTCRSLNVLPGRFHGGALNGNQSRDFLRNAMEFVGVLDLVLGAEQRAEEYLTILAPLNSLHSHTTSTYITDSAISSIVKEQKNLRDAVLSSGWLHFTPKMHLLCFHLDEVAVQYRSLGLHTEQGLEHLHKRYKDEEQNFLQTKQSERATAVSKRLNGKHLELLTNPWCQLFNHLLEYGDQEESEDTT